MKKMRLFLLLFAAVLSVGSFTACSDDDDDSSVTTSSNSIVGRWFYSEDEPSFYYYSIFEFHENNTFVYEDNDKGGLCTGTYLYVPEENFLKLNNGINDSQWVFGSQGIFWISIQGDRMTLRYRDEDSGLEPPEVYIRQE